MRQFLAAYTDPTGDCVSPSSKQSRVYITDDGLIVPCIDAETRHRLFEQAFKRGFTKQRLIECMGRRYRSTPLPRELKLKA